MSYEGKCQSTAKSSVWSLLKQCDHSALTHDRGVRSIAGTPLSVVAFSFRNANRQLPEWEYCSAPRTGEVLACRLPSDSLEWSVYQCLIGLSRCSNLLDSKHVAV